MDSASLAAVLPLTMVDGPSRDVTVETYQRRRDEDLRFLFNVVGPDYLRTLRIGLVTGREFDRRDDQSTRGVAIVNDTMARRFWGAPANAIGKRLRFTDGGDWRTIIGVARDVKYARSTAQRHRGRSRARRVARRHTTPGESTLRRECHRRNLVRRSVGHRPLGIALMASLIPSWRGARINPIAALRHH